LRGPDADALRGQSFFLMIFSRFIFYKYKY
jgi:hypothetical protein